MSKIGQVLQETLQMNSRPRKMSHRRPTSLVDIDLSVEWHPSLYRKDQNVHEAPLKLLDNIVCATGSWCEAQITTVSEYLRQTWPITCETTILLFEKMFDSSQAPEFGEFDVSKSRSVACVNNT